LAAIVAVRVVALEFISGVWGPNGGGDGAAVVRTFADRVASRAGGAVQLELLLYSVVIAAVYAFDNGRRLRERERQAAALRVQLAEAQLAALRLQMQPHFLFNTLHAVGSLVREHETEAALATLEGLATLLRRSLESTADQRVPLADELETVRLYAEIQQTRFGEFLTVTITAPPELHGVLVPSLLLQPLVENAVRHGTAKIAGAGRIDVRIFRDGRRIHIDVADNGPGVDRLDPGVGLANIRERLQLLYGSDHTLTLETRPTGGALAHIELPAAST
jgi:LytS/YehU family sensor histidine kinase